MLWEAAQQQSIQQNNIQQPLLLQRGVEEVQSSQRQRAVGGQRGKVSSVGEDTEARETADKFTRFMAENADEFGKEIEFVFERRVSVPLSKMLIGRLRNRAQSTLHKYFS
jgi:hypothetical protein